MFFAVILLNIFFLMWLILKLFIVFLALLILFYISWIFGHGPHGILAPLPRIEGKILTTELPGKSLTLHFKLPRS